jgi:hypothetical protein
MGEALEASITALQDYLAAANHDFCETPQSLLAGRTWEEQLQAVRAAIACRAAGEAARPQHYQLSMARRFMAGAGNHVAYLPLGEPLLPLLRPLLRPDQDWAASRTPGDS